MTEKIGVMVKNIATTTLAWIYLLVLGWMLMVGFVLFLVSGYIFCNWLLGSVFNLY